MHPVQMYICRMCGQRFDSPKAAVEHAHREHAKEMSHFKVKALREAWEREPSEENYMNFQECVSEHTRKFLMNESDTKSVYSVAEVLGDTELHRLFQSAESCNYKGCRHEEPDPDMVTRILATQK